MSDIDELTEELSRVLDEYCDHCGLNALAVHLTISITRVSNSPAGACNLADEITDQMKRTIYQSWDDIKALPDEAEDNSETRH